LGLIDTKLLTVDCEELDSAANGLGVVEMVGRIERELPDWLTADEWDPGRTDRRLHRGRMCQGTLTICRAGHRDRPPAHSRGHGCGRQPRTNAISQAGCGGWERARSRPTYQEEGSIPAVSEIEPKRARTYRKGFVGRFRSSMAALPLAIGCLLLSRQFSSHPFDASGIRP